MCRMYGKQYFHDRDGKDSGSEEVDWRVRSEKIQFEYPGNVIFCGCLPGRGGFPYNLQYEI